MFMERYRNRLNVQRQSGLYRNPPRIRRRQGRFLWIKNRPRLNFASNDYLGLGDSRMLREKAAANFARYATSASSSRLVSGNFDLLNQAESAYAQYFGYADALFFPSGYQANLGVLSAVFEPGDTVLFDKHIHASSVKGLVLSGARLQGYNHNDWAHLRKRLHKIAPCPAGVVTESLFSMDGDLLDVDSLAALKKKFGCWTIVDEAHALGVLGSGGCGLGRAVADIAIGTFGKALGLFGAFALLPAELKAYLLNFSSPQIYTTTLPEAHAATALDVLALLAQCDAPRAHLHRLSHQTRTALRQEGFTVHGDAHILAVVIGSEHQALATAQALFEKDIFVLPARYPTVPLGKAILRISLTARHTTSDVERLIDGLKAVTKSHAGKGPGPSPGTQQEIHGTRT